jgi:hypothetical protein
MYFRSVSRRKRKEGERGNAHNQDSPGPPPVQVLVDESRNDRTDDRSEERTSSIKLHRSADFSGCEQVGHTSAGDGKKRGSTGAGEETTDEETGDAVGEDGHELEDGEEGETDEVDRRTTVPVNARAFKQGGGRGIDGMTYHSLRGETSRGSVPMPRTKRESPSVTTSCET